MRRDPFDHGPSAVSLHGLAQHRSGDVVVAVIDDENLVVDADQGLDQPLLEGRDVAGLVAGRDHDRKLRSPIPPRVCAYRSTERPIRGRPTVFPHAVPLPIAWGALHGPPDPR